MGGSAPTSIGSYDILALLGRGGMGAVYRARHRETALEVAIKLVEVTQAALLESMRREIHALARLRHPGIVSVVDEGDHEGSPWYAMELIEGLDLRRHLAVRDPGSDPRTTGPGTSPRTPRRRPS